MTCGIYKITNTETNKVYVGSSKNIPIRIRSHFSLLKSKSHHSVKLQRAYNKYGAKNFTHEIIELCEQPDLFIREQYWIDSLDSYKSGYNSSAFSNRPSNKYSLSFLDKNSKKIETLISNLIEIQSLRQSLPDNLKISCGFLNAASSGERRFNRYIKATKIIKNILIDCQSLSPDLEYHVNGVNYSPTAIESYRIKPIAKGMGWWKMHLKFKSENIYDQLLQIFILDLINDKYGVWLMTEMNDRGFGFDTFENPIAGYD